jgi:HK97 family phage prohead protease
MSKTQLRIYDADFRMVQDGEKPYFEGTPIVFNTLSSDLGGFKEIIDRGAWDSADTSECFAVFNHKEENLLGTASAGTLRFIRVDDGGVHVEIDKSNTNISRDCAEWVERKEVNKMSFKFTIKEDDWAYDKDTDTLIRTVKQFGKIYDVSLVTRPAYKEATVRSVDEADLAEIRSKLIPEEDNQEYRSECFDYYNYKLKLNEHLKK